MLLALLALQLPALLLADSWNAGNSPLVDLSFSGGEYQVSVTTQVGSAYTVAPGDRRVRCNNSVAMTVNLPAATGSGRVLDFKLVNAVGTCTIDGNGADTIDGSPTRLLSVLNQTVQIVDIASAMWDVQ